ncbi:hypothetical protein FB45DRAFT_1008185 [Roridomyces roridus]|uniref:Uncharacterized protein n=1 Tax=Roridomyces roridus TaxID=1738132 RepID=A0AAD7BBP9_9AGAR|nr:hypothetical protein FB45DRAFT_1008185 [Roridomyces roridus]
MRSLRIWQYTLDKANGDRLGNLTRRCQTIQDWLFCGQYSIFQHSVNAGSVPWQVAIHALVIEAIRRDDYDTEYQNHNQLGRGLNGLLPRRARLCDLKEKGGSWQDLAWLLELNQGFYNAASLADKGRTVSWMGNPINPAAGNERLEPVVTAFPVSRAGYSDPQLSIIGCETIGLRPHPLKRDAYGLYNNREMRLVKWLSIVLCIAVVVIGGVASQGDVGTIFLLLYIACMVYCLIEMLISTMYLERAGWAFFEDSMYGEPLESKLRKQDPNLGLLTYWGDCQLVPQWEAPPRRTHYNASLVDLRNRVCMRTTVVDRSNALVPLAIHGSGATCMLLKRPKDGDKDATYFAQKVGMCNLPPYIFSQTVRSGTIFVGEHKEEKGCHLEKMSFNPTSSNIRDPSGWERSGMPSRRN